MKAESYLSKRVQRDLKTLPYCWIFKSSERAVRGIPDIIGVIEGQFFALELKSKEGSPSKLQLKVLSWIREAGGIGIVVYPSDWPQAFQYLKGVGEARMKAARMKGRERF